MKPKFEIEQDGLVIVDPIGRKRYPIKTNTAISPTHVEENHISRLYRVESSVVITTDSISIPENNVIYVRDLKGSLCTEIHLNENISLPENEYILDLSGPMKVYAYVNSAIQARIGTTRTEISFGEATEVTIGARSFHHRPAETITTTADPTDVMEAISTFGSALKSTTPERSYPTHRGHPPTVELASELSIPDGLQQPETGIRIEIPPTLRHAFVITPLAYYLGADVIPGPDPRIITDTGYSQTLSGKCGFEPTVERILRQVFFLDCIIQTEGETPDQLYERQIIEPDIEFEIEELYDRTITEQLEAYLEVPFEAIREKVPKWYSEVHLKPTAEYIESLPFVANDLVSVKTTERVNNPVASTQRTKRNSQVGSIDDNIRNIRHKTVDSTVNSENYSSSPIVQQCWRGNDGTDIVSTKPLPAFRNSITQPPRDGSLSVEVICNDPKMNDELVTVRSTYSEGSTIPFDLTVHHDLSKEELSEVFTKESDFVHYIGHIDSDGFRCTNGGLDIKTIESIGTKIFFLNACDSYEQGINLIEAGSVGGIVTLTEIDNYTAVTAGSRVARLLNSGIPLYAALEILQKTTNSGDCYHLLGDGAIEISQMDIGPPILAKVTRDESNYEVSFISYGNSRYKPGSIYTVYIPVAESYYLVSGEIDFSKVPKEDLIDFFNKENTPVMFEGELRWSTEIKTSEL